MRHFVFGALFLCTCAQAQQAAPLDFIGGAPGKGWQAYADVQAWAAYDGIALRDLDRDWPADYTPKRGRNMFLQRHRAEFGARKDDWQLAIEYRYEGTLSADEETLKLYQLYQRKVKLDSAQSFRLDAHLKSWSAAGLRAGRAFRFGGAAGDGPVLLVSGALYAHPRTRDIDASGNVSYDPASGYGANGSYLEASTRYRYDGMRELAQNGSGASLSLALEWPLGEHFSASVALNDIWSRMHWSNLPTVRKNINSTVASYDQDGYVNYHPLLSGQNSQLGKDGTIGASSAWKLQYRLDRWSLQAGIDRVAGTTMPATALSYDSTWGAFTASYASRFKMFGLGYGYGPLRVQLRADRLPLNSARAAAVDAHLFYAF